MRPLRSLGLVLLALAVVPALAFAAYQVWAVSESEALLARVRDEQLGTLLFTVNQHAWETADDWAERLERLAPADGPLGAPAPRDALEAFLVETPAVLAVVAVDSAFGVIEVGTEGRYLRAEGPEATGTVEWAPSVARLTLHARPAGAGGSVTASVRQPGAGPGQTVDLLAPERVARLRRRRAVGYRQLEPVVLPDSSLALTFVTADGGPGAPPRAFALIVRPGPFIQSVIGPKLQELAAGGLTLAVLRGDSVLAATQPVAAAAIRQTRALWLLPEHRVGIAPGDEAAEGVLRARARQGLWLIGAVAVLLLAGAALAFRGVRREVEVAQREVEVARLRQDFIQNVSHELRTPLALIRMYAETLAEGRVPEGRLQGYYRTLVAEAERLSRLVGNVLHFARFERGAAALAHRPLDLAALVAETAERYRPVLEEAGLALALDAAPTPPVHGDADALAESVVNLLDNAAKYGAGTVTVRTGAADGHAFVEVEDEGPGLPAAERERVFEAFHRVQPASADGLVHTAKGTGLGLALVRRIARGLGGDAAALDPTGPAGARFRLSLPAAAPAPVTAAPAHA